MLGTVEGGASPPVLSRAAGGRVWRRGIVWGGGGKDEGRCRWVMEERARGWVGSRHGRGRREGAGSIEATLTVLGLACLASVWALNLPS